MTPLFTLVVVQALLGAFDNLWHHEITERLPARRSAAPELALHSAREFLYAVFFLGLAWYEWRGAWAYALAALMLVEIGITLADFVVEDASRRLPRLERVLHTILAINAGAILAVLAPVAAGWAALETELARIDHGAVSWLFSLFAAVVFAWSVRNAFAVLHHRRPPRWIREPWPTPAVPTGRTILVSGATGFIGSHLLRRLHARGDALVVLTRDPDRALDQFGPHVRIVTDLAALDVTTRIDAIVNLAGERILGLPWTRARRERLLRSRVDTTTALVALCARLAKPPRVFVSASAIGYYGVRDDAELDENTAPQAVFQSRLCQEWEAAAVAAVACGVRVVTLRLGLVLGADGGALPALARPVRLGLGASLGTGRQWMSWIHVVDAVRLVQYAIDRPSLRGPVNAVAPGAVTHADFQRELARILRRPCALRLPAWPLRVALGEMSQLLLDGQRVVPARALAQGFAFRHPSLEGALRDLLRGNGLRDAVPAEAVYFNGDCPVCSAEIAHYARRCAAGDLPLRFVDSMQQPQALLAHGLRGEHLEQRLFLRRADGNLYSGVPAMLELWNNTPGYRWLARVVSLPGVLPVAEFGYDHLVAPGLARLGRWRRRRREGARDAVGDTLGHR